MHWILTQVGPVEYLFSAETMSQPRNNICSITTAHQHVALAIEYTCLSCLHYLKLALDILVLKECSNSRRAGNEAVEDFINNVPKFDTSFLGNSFKFNDDNDSSEIFTNYELSFPVRGETLSF